MKENFLKYLLGHTSCKQKMEMKYNLRSQTCYTVRWKSEISAIIINRDKCAYTEHSKTNIKITNFP